MQHHHPSERYEFAPPPQRGSLRALILAVLAHLLLLAALTWGVHWKQESDSPAVEAELWSAVPRQAAPRAVEQPTPPPPPQPPAPAPVPAPAPPPPPPAPAPVPDTRDADIALQRQKEQQQREKLRQQQLEQARLQKQKEEREKAEKAEKAAKAEKERAEREKAEKAAREKEAREKEAREKQAQLDKQKQQQAAEEKKKQEQAKAQQEAKRLEAERLANIKRLQGLAGATGGATATGSDLRSSGPSGSYGGKVAAKVRPNIVFSDDAPGNPRAEVEVRAAPDGTIVGRRLTKSSGNPAWDDAVLKAIDKTETLPRDIDGRVPSSLVIGFRPRD